MLYGAAYDDTCKKVCEIQKESVAVILHPFDNEHVIVGQGTIALEILDELPDLDMIIVPIGGGELISGIATATKLINPKIEIVGVETENISFICCKQCRKRSQ